MSRLSSCGLIAVRRICHCSVRIAPASKEAAYAYGYLIHCDPLDDLRTHAVGQLMKLGPNAAAASPLLVEFLKSKASDTKLLCEVMQCVARIGPRTGEAIPPLVKLCKSKNPKVAAAAASALRSVRTQKRSKSGK